METKKTNCVNIAYIFKTSLGSINGSWTEGNVSTVKKITMPNGQQLPYVSGQSLKYQIRKAWKEMGLEEMLSGSEKAEKEEGVDSTMGQPFEFLDDDLLGYMIASKQNNRRRTGVVRTSAAIGMFPLKNDRDLGTKSKEEHGDMGEGGNLFETEIYYNYFRVNVLVELDRLGCFQDFELDKASRGKTENLSIEKKRERLVYLLKALSNIWGGGKQSRLLTDMSPKFVVITFQDVKAPIFLETLKVNENEELDVKTVREVLESNKGKIANQYVGVQSGIFKNDVVSELDGVEVNSIQETFNKAIDFIGKLNF